MQTEYLRPTMKNHTLNTLLDYLTPWFETEYIQSVIFHEDNTMIVRFSDGLIEVISMTECSKRKLDQGFRRLEEKGLPVVQA